MAFLDETGLGRVIERFKNIFVPASRTINGISLTNDIIIGVSETAGFPYLNPFNWPDGQVIQLSEHVKGLHKTGVVTVGANTWSVQLLASMPSQPHIIDCGGWWSTGSPTERAIGTSMGASAGQSFLIYADGPALYYSTIFNVARSNYPFDIWITYTGGD